jgi:hypothetical protein
MNLTIEEQKLIYNAVRYYQMNRVPLNGGAYQTCDAILNKMFSTVKELSQND